MVAREIDRNRMVILSKGQTDVRSSFDLSVCVEGSRGEAISARSCSASRVQSCVRPINAAALTAGLEGFRQDHAPDRLDGLRRPTR